MPRKTESEFLVINVRFYSVINKNIQIYNKINPVTSIVLILLHHFNRSEIKSQRLKTTNYVIRGIVMIFAVSVVFN